MSEKEKELRKMSRVELIEIIYALEQSEEKLQKEKEELENQLSERRILLSEAGSIAEAAMGLSRIFQTAQETADQYLNSVAAMQVDSGKKAKMLISDAKQQAENTLAEAKTQAETMLAETQNQTEIMLAEARNQAESTVSEAQSRAEALLSEANQQAGKTVREAQAQAHAAHVKAEECLQHAMKEKERLETETEQAISEKWSVFDQKVKEILEAHSELGALLSHR